MLFESKEYAKNLSKYPLDKTTKNHIIILIEPTIFKITIMDLKVLIDVLIF